MPYKTPEEAKAYRRAYYIKHREKLIQATKDWVAQQTPEQLEATRIRKLDWANSNYDSEKSTAASSDYYHTNRDRVLEQKKQRRMLNPEAVKLVSKASVAKNRERIRLRQKEWRKNNPEAFLKLQRDYRQRRNALNKLRRAENPTRKLAENCRSRICHILKREKVTKSQSTFKFIGCTAEFFREFLEHQFTDGMTWQNYGIFWNVDHVIPIASFQLHNPDHLRNAFHYSNCRPLKVEENSEKNDTLPSSHQPLFL